MSLSGSLVRDGDRRTLEAAGPREFICLDCLHRCTRGTEGLEYGHARQPRCPRRPIEVDPAGRGASANR